MRRPSRALTDLRGFRRQLVLLAGAGAAIVAAALALVAQLVLATTSNHTVDRVLEDRTDAVIALTQAATSGATLSVPDRGLDPGTVVYDARGRVVAGSEPPSLRGDFAALSGTHGTASRQVDGRFQVAAESFRTPSGAAGVVVAAEPLSPYERDETQALLVSVAAGVLIVLLTIGVATWISHRALSPVADMARTAEDWSEHDLERRFDLGPPTDEIRALAHTLDGLLDKVGHAIRTEQRLTSELAHELRTPLTAIQGTADLLEMRDDLAPDVRTDVEAIGRATRGMAATITVLVDLARRGPDASAGTCAVAELFGEIARRQPEVELGAVDAGWVLDVPLDIALSAVNPVLDNAIRLAGAARLDAEEHPEHIDVLVSDEGPGVADPDVLFRPGAVPGRSGLGLSLARRIARSVGGDVLLDERARARGAAFVVRLPRA